VRRQRIHREQKHEENLEPIVPASFSAKKLPAGASVMGAPDPTTSLSGGASPTTAVVTSSVPHDMYKLSLCIHRRESVLRFPSYDSRSRTITTRSSHPRFLRLRALLEAIAPIEEAHMPPCNTWHRWRTVDPTYDEPYPSSKDIQAIRTLLRMTC